MLAQNLPSFFFQEEILIWYYLKWCSFSIANLKLIKYIHPEKSNSSYKTFILYIWSFCLKIFVNWNFAIVSSMTNVLKAQSTIKSKMFQIDNAMLYKRLMFTRKKIKRFVTWVTFKSVRAYFATFSFLRPQRLLLTYTNYHKGAGGCQNLVGTSLCGGCNLPFPH